MHTDVFSEMEIKLQIKMLEGFIEILCESLKTLDQNCKYLQHLSKLRKSYKDINLKLREYWTELINLTVKLLTYVSSLNLEEKKLRHLLSLILALADYFQCLLIYKKELVEDFLGEEEKG